MSIRKYANILGPFTKYIVATIAALLIITQWDNVIEFTDVMWEHNSQQSANTKTNGNKGATNADGKTKKQEQTPAEHNSGSNTKGKTKQVEGESVAMRQGIKIASWNMCNIGISKDDEELDFMSKLLRYYDIVAIQEISTKLSGPRAITKLNEALNRRGQKWTYIISDPTSGAGSERYAYLWKEKSVELKGRPWLVTGKSLDDDLAREPFMARFKVNELELTKHNAEVKEILLANFHAVPTAKKPANEINLLAKLHQLYRKDKLLIAGDFNLSQKHDSFNKLKNYGYIPSIVDKKTSLRMYEKEGSYLAQEYDNIFYESGELVKLRGGVIDFVPRLPSLKAARSISDHLPVWCEINFK